MRDRLSSLLVRIVLLFGIALPALPARGQSGYVDPYRFWKWPRQDVSALLERPDARHALAVAGAAGVLYLVARHDQEVSDELIALRTPETELTFRIVEEVGNAKAMRPLALLVFAGSLMTDDPRLQDAAFTSLEAVVVANTVTNVLKTAFGRARPYQGVGADVFKPFSGNTSFPSGHATTAFALVTPWLLYYPNAVTPVLLVVSAGTAAVRISTGFHWLSDVLAGSAIGFTTAYWLTRRHQQQTRRVEIAPTLDGGQPGVSLVVRLD